MKNDAIYRAYASCSFGLEAVVRRELEELGAQGIAARDARVYFDADAAMIARANLWLTTADRVYIVLAEFPAKTFDELFEGVRAVRFADYLPKNARFPVSGDAVRSTLMSVSDIQAITKKAAVDSMAASTGLRFYKEDGDEYPIYVSIFSDIVTLCINTSGSGLNRRGYRVKNAVAPLRETLAAGMIKISRWSDRPFYDPMCGSGTIAIEAALMASNRAPGLRRQFSAQYFGGGFEKAFGEERSRAQQSIRKAVAPVFASDIDEKMVEMTRFHAGRAGVADAIEVYRADVTEFSPKNAGGTLITNPPYAVRMGELDQVRGLYAQIGKRLSVLPEFRYYFICADEEFERHFGAKADKKRKLYNGNMKCGFYQYFRKKGK